MLQFFRTHDIINLHLIVEMARLVCGRCGNNQELLNRPMPPKAGCKSSFHIKSIFLIISRKSKVDFEAFFKPDRESKRLLLLSYRYRIIDFSKATDT